jgi:hypothetical protein
MMKRKVSFFFCNQYIYRFAIGMVKLLLVIFGQYCDVANMAIIHRYISQIWLIKDAEIKKFLNIPI